MLALVLLAQTAPAATPSNGGMEIRDWLSLGALLISIVSLCVSFFIALKTHERSIYDTVDSAIEDLLKVQLEHPQYRDKAFCDALLDKPTTDVERLRLEVYIIMAYNTLETLYEKFGEKRLTNSCFLPAMKAVARRHRKWLYIDDHEDAYDRKMINFLEANKK